MVAKVEAGLPSPLDTSRLGGLTSLSTSTSQLMVSPLDSPFGSSFSALQHWARSLNGSENVSRVGSGPSSTTGSSLQLFPGNQTSLSGGIRETEITSNIPAHKISTFQYLASSTTSLQEGAEDLGDNLRPEFFFERREGVVAATLGNRFAIRSVNLDFPYSDNNNLMNRLDAFLNFHKRHPKPPIYAPPSFPWTPEPPLDGSLLQYELKVNDFVGGTPLFSTTIHLHSDSQFPISFYTTSTGKFMHIPLPYFDPLTTPKLLLVRDGLSSSFAVNRLSDRLAYVPFFKLHMNNTTTTKPMIPQSPAAPGAQPSAASALLNLMASAAASSSTSSIPNAPARAIPLPTGSTMGGLSASNTSASSTETRPIYLSAVLSPKGLGVGSLLASLLSHSHLYHGGLRLSDDWLQSLRGVQLGTTGDTSIRYVNIQFSGGKQANAKKLLRFKKKKPTSSDYIHVLIEPKKVSSVPSSSLHTSLRLPGHEPAPEDSFEALGGPQPTGLNLLKLKLKSESRMRTEPHRIRPLPTSRFNVPLKLTLPTAASSHSLSTTSLRLPKIKLRPPPRPTVGPLSLTRPGDVPLPPIKKIKFKVSPNFANPHLKMPEPSSVSQKPLKLKLKLSTGSLVKQQEHASSQPPNIISFIKSNQQDATLVKQEEPMIQIQPNQNTHPLRPTAQSILPQQSNEGSIQTNPEIRSQPTVLKLKLSFKPK
jgi:hypothetical protein